MGGFSFIGGYGFPVPGARFHELLQKLLHFWGDLLLYQIIRTERMNIAFHSGDLALRQTGHTDRLSFFVHTAQKIVGADLENTGYFNEYVIRRQPTAIFVRRYGGLCHAQSHGKLTLGDFLRHAQFFNLVAYIHHTSHLHGFLIYKKGVFVWLTKVAQIVDACVYLWYTDSVQEEGTVYARRKTEK